MLPASLLALALVAPLAPRQDEVEPPAHPVPSGLQAQINEAIGLGVESLLARQSLDGSWTQQIESYAGGMTGLALYALMKSGVSTEHPAVERGFAFLRRHGVPDKTYARATVLLALTTRGREEDEEWIEEIVEALVDSQVQLGWGYPGSPDLSNTQFAAMALRAADAAGVKISAKVWTRLADAALLYLEEAEGAAKSGYAARGFKYRSGDADATGSMTGAGVAVLSISLDHVRGRRDKYVRALEGGRAWLGEHFTVEKNPAPSRKGGGHGHPMYYLYGLERVGSLLGVETLGEHPWYLMGAEHIVGKQEANGAWGGESDTAFGLLFLSRATGSLGPASADGKGVVASRWTFGEDDPEHDVSLRASGRNKMTMWISSFGEDASFEHGTGEDGTGPLAVERVEYWQQPSKPGEAATLLATYEVEDAEEAARKRFAVQCDLLGPMTLNVVAAVHLEGEDEPLRSKPLLVRVATSDRPSWDEYATDHDRNLLVGARLEVTASSERTGARERARNVVDGMIGLGWKPLAEDEAPWIRVEIARPIRANTIVLSHAQTSGDFLGRFEIVLNGREKRKIEGRLVPDGREKTVLEFPKATRVDDILIRFDGPVPPGCAGLGEIELQLRR